MIRLIEEPNGHRRRRAQGKVEETDDLTVPVQRQFHASAGTIKSGGATRRAAKMVILDVDHPDIEDFIQTKVKEEEKIRALRVAGFDMDLGGGDITSVQYQNANNSVRVNDTFMKAVENGDKFGLTSRMTGEVIEEVEANGSNPCSEYMNTSCNLASLNLVKFLKDDGKGHQSFEVERFAKVVELVITAMDISICFARH